MIGEIITGLSSIIGGGISAAGSAYGQRQQIAWERERAKNAHQWEVEDLKKAGLNPILSAGGSGASTGGVGGIDASGISQGINSALNYQIQKQQLKNEKQRIINETNTTNANVVKTLADAEQTKDLTPELIKTQQWNRQTVGKKAGKELYQLGSDIFNSAHAIAPYGIKLWKKLDNYVNENYQKELKKRQQKR